VSGIKLINAVNHNRAIDKIIKVLLRSTSRLSEKKRYGILTHANRLFSGYILSTTQGLRNATNIMAVDESRINVELNRILSVTENLIESEFPTAYPARFFSNVDKITLTLSRLNNGN
jgi:hypothetical protein